MTNANVTRLIDELRHLPLDEIQSRLDTIDAERQALMMLRRLAVRAQRATEHGTAADRQEARR